MKWRINIPVHAPISGLSHPQRHYSAVVQLKPLFTLQKMESTYGSLLGDSGFEMRFTESWEQLPPLPWKKFLGVPSPTELKNAYYAEAAISLGMFDVHEFRKKQPLSAGKIYHQLTHINFPQNIQEAFAFALFDFKVSLDNQPSLEEWQNDVRHVIYEHGKLTRICQPESVLLRHGYQLLDLVSQQRQKPPSFEEFITAWNNFNQQATIKLPLIFSLVYWKEAAYCLTEMDNTADTQKLLLEKQHQVENELLTLLPSIGEDLANLFDTKVKAQDSNQS